MEHPVLEGGQDENVVDTPKTVDNSDADLTESIKTIKPSDDCMFFLILQCNFLNRWLLTAIDIRRIFIF